MHETQLISQYEKQLDTSSEATRLPQFIFLYEQWTNKIWVFHLNNTWFRKIIKQCRKKKERSFMNIKVTFACQGGI